MLLSSIESGFSSCVLLLRCQEENITSPQFSVLITREVLMYMYVHCIYTHVLNLFVKLDSGFVLPVYRDTYMYSSMNIVICELYM